MKKGFSITYLFMIAIAAYCTYGVFYSYLSLDKIMWGAIFGILFCLRYILKDILKVGYVSMTQSSDEITGNQKFLYMLQKAFSFAIYISPLIIAFSDLIYSKASLVFITIAMITISLDLLLWSMRKNNKDVLV
ncbi:hypothetical protein [Metabacillus malikii]|uniref:Uncharacterized protein n=1 Tax=Metabacillus malikii TaxID=1504265 RepID=A0ABT9ZG12_9BACI|nr:hypothetical protein [Metabacillus malikii]MDQ0230736.1 hypothetical protein [Metabacillus malikii]